MQLTGFEAASLLSQIICVTGLRYRLELTCDSGQETPEQLSGLLERGAISGKQGERLPKPCANSLSDKLSIFEIAHENDDCLSGDRFARAADFERAAEATGTLRHLC